MVLGATVIAAALGLAASALEHISPTTSGFGPWHPLELIPGFGFYPVSTDGLKRAKNF